MTNLSRSSSGGHGGHGGHGWMMMACCIPMIVIAVALVASGTAGSGVIVGALLCTAMMAAMMLAMPGGHGQSDGTSAADEGHGHDDHRSTGQRL